MSFWNRLAGGGGSSKQIQRKGEPSLNIKEGEEKRRALCRAAKDGNLYAVTQLIAEGVDLNGADEYGSRAICNAVDRRRADILSALIAAGADVNVRQATNRWTGLHCAANNDDAIAIPLLVAAGASLQAKCSEGFSPLDWADSMHPNAADALRAAEREPRNQNLLRWERANLIRWEKAWVPWQWVKDRHSQWNHSDWDALLEDLKRSDFWPMEPEAIGWVLEEYKRATTEPAVYFSVWYLKSQGIRTAWDDLRRTYVVVE